MKRDVLPALLQRVEDLPPALALAQIENLPAPMQLRAEFALTPSQTQTVLAQREVVRQILTRRDPRLLVVVGPCSIHDVQAAAEYAQRLAQLAKEVADTLFVVMRVYVEKPRTSLGWKGLLNDPQLDGSCQLAQGLTLSRQVLRQVVQTGLPVAVEALDPLAPHYLADLVTWCAIGARTTESQTHREMASSLGLPVGFKNGSDGSVDAAIQAILAARHAHTMLGIDELGRVAAVQSRGNPDGHLVLRGGKAGPNYQAKAVAEAAQSMHAAGLPANIMIDCSHGNAGRQHLRQIEVMQEVLAQRLEGGTDSAIIGVMLESFLAAGKQDIASPQLRYGCSVTDACLDWESTEQLLRQARNSLHPQIQRAHACMPGKPKLEAA